VLDGGLCYVIGAVKKSDNELFFWGRADDMSEESLKKYSIILADDHVLIRHGIKNIIKQHNKYEVIGEVADGEELLKMLNRSPADLVIVDITMPKCNGVEAAEIVKRRFPRTKVLMLTMHKSKEYFSQAMSVGAEGYLIKDDSDKELLIAIDTIRKGKIYVSPFFAESFTDDVIEAYRSEEGNLVKKLSKREKEVLQLVAKGLTSKEVADKLNVSPRTVDTHRANLLKKFNCKKTIDLVNYAVRCGLVKSDSY